MSDPVTRLNAAQGGHYAIECELGEGGMESPSTRHSAEVEGWSV